MEDFNSETESDYTSYWRDWVSYCVIFLYSSYDFKSPRALCLVEICGMVPAFSPVIRRMDMVNFM